MSLERTLYSLIERKVTMKALKSGLAMLLMSACAVAMAHGNDHPSKASQAPKEQKEWGIGGDAKSVRRTIEIGMSDTMRFTPEQIEVRQGDTVKFVVRNSGKTMHEFVIGTRAENDKHAELMKKFPNMEHDEPYMAHVAPGKRGEIVWTFNRAGDFEFACLIAGHYQAGMVGTIVVAA